MSRIGAIDPAPLTFVHLGGTFRGSAGGTATETFSAATTGPADPTKVIVFVAVALAAASRSISSISFGSTPVNIIGSWAGISCGVIGWLPYAGDVAQNITITWSGAVTLVRYNRYYILNRQYTQPLSLTAQQVTAANRSISLKSPPGSCGVFGMSKHAPEVATYGGGSTVMQIGTHATSPTPPRYAQVGLMDIYNGNQPYQEIQANSTTAADGILIGASFR